MIYSNASGPTQPANRTLAAIAKFVFATAVALTAGSAFAQQPAAPAAAPTAKPAAPAKKPAPAKPPAAAAPTAPAPEAQQQAPAQGQQQQAQLIFSPWTKFCNNGQNNDPNAKICFTGKDARIESGMPVASAVLIEPEGQPKKLLRVTLPLGMQLVHGTRVIVDQDQPMTGPYVICIQNGCMADYEASADLVAKMKKGQQLTIQGIASVGQPISIALPLTEFAKAYDGPPSDPKVFEAQQKKLQEELQRRADEARKKIESEQGQPQSSNPPPPAPQASGKP